MVKNKIKLYCVLLMFFVFMAMVSLSVGTTFARYENTVSCATLLETSEKTIISDCFRDRTKETLTVLLGELDVKDTKEVVFSMTSSGQATKGNIRWIANKYVNVSMKYGEANITSGAEIELPANAEKEFTLILTRTEEDSPSTDEEALVYVSFGEKMQGIFSVTIPGTSGMDINSGTQQGIVEGNSGSSSSLNSPGSSETEENTGKTENTEDYSAGTGTTEVASEEISSEPLYANASDSAAADSEQTNTENTENTPTEEENSSETVIVGENSENVSLKISAVSKFDPKQALPLMIETSGTDYVHIGFESGGKIAELPAKTIYSTDNGKTNYMLYDSGVAKIKTSGAESISVLLDFSNAEIGETPEMTVRAEGYSDDICYMSKTINVMPNAAENLKTTFEHLQASEETSEEQTEEQELPILFYGSTLKVEFPQEWLGEDYTMDYSLEMLTVKESGEAEYQKLSVTESEDSETSGQKKNEITFTIGDNMPQAGTYRLNVNWKYKGISFHSKQVVFFINYTVNTGNMMES